MPLRRLPLKKHLRLDDIGPSPNSTHRNLISSVFDRLGHDRRYAIDASKLERELDWRAEVNFDTGIRKTVRWFVDQQPLWRAIAKWGYTPEPLRLFVANTRNKVKKSIEPQLVNDGARCDTIGGPPQSQAASQLAHSAATHSRAV